MKRRSTGTSLQVAGAAVLSAWVLAACGLEMDDVAATPSRPVSADTALPTLDEQGVRGTVAMPERRVSARIESGEITRIERVAPATAPRSAAEQSVYRIVVRLQDGMTREFTEPSIGELRVGDRVQVVRNGAQPTT